VIYRLTWGDRVEQASRVSRLSPSDRGRPAGRAAASLRRHDSPLPRAAARQRV